MSVIFAAPEATIEDLAHVPGKAEIVNGRIVLMPPTGIEPGFAGDEIYASLRLYGQRTGLGRAVGDNKGFRVELPARRSFSPDAAFVLGHPTGMGFYQGSPIFAVEVRSENDYGPRAELDMAQKRADYFEAGTEIVWDVDLKGDEGGKLIRAYSAQSPQSPRLLRAGEQADAEPALPGWRLAVDDLADAS